MSTTSRRYAYYTCSATFLHRLSFQNWNFDYHIHRFYVLPSNRGSLLCSTSNVVIVIIALNKNINRASISTHSPEFRVSRQISPVTYKIHLPFRFFTLCFYTPFFPPRPSFGRTRMNFLPFSLEMPHTRRIIWNSNACSRNNKYVYDYECEKYFDEIRSYPFVRIIFLHETKKKWKRVADRLVGERCSEYVEKWVRVWERKLRGYGKEKYFCWKIIPMFVVRFYWKIFSFCVK